MRRYELTDEQWQRLAPLLPPQRPWTGRPNHDHRTIINGILWVLRTGAPWADLPERYGFDREAYRARNRVERLFNRLKQFRRIATRYEKRAQNYLAMLHIAAITLWL